MPKVLITGCAGFIGSHLSQHFLDAGAAVTGIDDLSRPGSEVNLTWLQGRYPQLDFRRTDIRDFRALEDIFKHGRFDLVIHEASQVAVTTSVKNPRLDFEINALGTFNVLEATRLYAPEAFFEFASTNKVYGKMEDLPVVEANGRYEYEIHQDGIDESYNLDFHSPYGCSKGAADQYVRDYSRIYGLRTVVLRQSCIYGTRQFGVTDQGWVAWFTIASIIKRPITIYGNGKQARDVLWIDDLVEVYDRCYRRADQVSGEIYNVGGGPDNLLSLLELLAYLKEAGVLKDDPAYAEWRPGDQKVFVCNIGKISRAIDWVPKTSPREGVARLVSWASEHKPLLEKLFT
jgi:CDP-paratose 2-epimerase